MSQGRFSGLLAKRAPGFTGAVFVGALALWFTSCGKKTGTPEWGREEVGKPAVAEVSNSVVAKPVSGRTTTAQAPPSAVAPPSTEGLRFIAYNVENWLTMDRFTDQKPSQNAPKPAAEKQAVIDILVSHSPDIVGLCEIGEAGDLAEIQNSLKAAGLDLPHVLYTGGSDPIRHLGLLSRFPITSRAKPAEVDYQLKGRTFAINRGILDATIRARGKSYRFLGVHLKSKREVEEADQEEMRIHEARLLRHHVDAILLTDTNARLIVYGDFNDTRPSKAFRTVTGNYNDPGYLTAIPAKDSRGEAWTHHWALHDTYSRFDYITVTRMLKPEVDFKTSRIIDDPSWSEASDHRPVLAVFK